MSQPTGRRAVPTIYDNVAQLIQAAADLCARLARISQEAPERRPFRVALSGGTTPRPLHALLAAPPYVDQIDWRQVEFYWGDERNVGPEDEQSNYRMARETLLQPLLDAGRISEAQMHRMRGELPAARAAEEYEGELRRSFGLSAGEWPRFDLILLGMGPDGHTASLFPHTAALAVRDRLAVGNHVPKLNTDRITLTVPVLNQAAAVVFLVAGADKADALREVLEGPPNPEEYPSQLIQQANGTLYWLVDRAAAAKLAHNS
jgi:6-phosphogluconolactonase